MVYATDQAMSPIIIALDTADLDQAVAWGRAVKPYVFAAKIGLELFLSHGSLGYRTIQAETGLPIVLDLKLHDIPTTMARAMRSLMALRPLAITVHGAAGWEGIEAAVDGWGQRSLILVVSSLTSAAFDPLRLTVARTHVGWVNDFGAAGIVCHPSIASNVRPLLGKKLIMTPSIGFAERGDDQPYRVPPRDAIEAGADWLVIGRPITAAPDPAAAAERFAHSLKK